MNPFADWVEVTLGADTADEYLDELLSSKSGRVSKIKFGNIYVDRGDYLKVLTTYGALLESKKYEILEYHAESCNNKAELVFRKLE